MGFYDNARSHRKRDAVILVDGSETADYKQCCHCGDFFVWRASSGKKRGFCLNCMDITCGKPGCRACLPHMKRLELFEKGKIPDLYHT